jgi:predicted Zn finger-like uncharacterized protein
MNVTCTGCPAKYAVPDHKVRGKKVRITCKHCGTNIIVDGSALSAEQSLAPKAPDPGALTASAPSPAKPEPAASESSFVVGFPDDRQETHTVSEIVSLYGSAKIDDESLVWKDGMPDWLAVFEVPEIAAAMRKEGIARRAPSFALSTPPEDERTLVVRSPFGDETEHALGAVLEPAKPTLAPAALRRSAAEIKLPVPAPTKPGTSQTAQPVAARRAEKRAGADLFAGVASAGSEADPSFVLGFPEEVGHKLTGARNESSVLFSLDALTKPDPKAAGQKKARDREQEKQASAALFGESSADSLMNVGGGGFSALAAPDFTRPVSIVPEAQVRPSDPVEVPNAPEKKKSAALWVVAALGFVAVAGAAFFVMQKKSGMDQAPDSLSAEPKTAALPAQPSAMQAPVANAAPEAPAASAAEAPAPSPAGRAAEAITAAGAKPAGTAAAATSTAAPASAIANKPADKPAEAKKPEAEPAPAPAPAADGAAFDKGAAVTALGAAAANAASCKTADGPTGSGKVSVTFAPSGRATMTNVGGAFAGTDVGSCVARLFRSARVPAFSGDAVTVSKSFSIE